MKPFLLLIIFSLISSQANAETRQLPSSILDVLDLIGNGIGCNGPDTSAVGTALQALGVNLQNINGKAVCSQICTDGTCKNVSQGRKSRSIAGSKNTELAPSQLSHKNETQNFDVVVPAASGLFIHIKSYACKCPNCGSDSTSCEFSPGGEGSPCFRALYDQCAGACLSTEIPFVCFNLVYAKPPPIGIPGVVLGNPFILTTRYCACCAKPAIE